MMHLGTLMLCVLAFACIALSMERHQDALFDQLLSARTTRILRILGWLMLAGALALELAQPLRGLGVVRWFGCLSAGAGLVFISLVAMARRR